MMIQSVVGYLISILLGVVFGALVNWLSDTLPLRRKPGIPPCPSCGEPRPWAAWSGILATLPRRRQCASCGKPLPWRHIIVEIVLMIAYAYLWMRYLGGSLSTLELPIIAFYLTLFLLIAVIDLEHRLVLNVVILPAIAFAILEGIFSTRQPVGVALVGGVVGLVLMAIVYGFGVLFSRMVKRARGEPLKEVAFGMGDVTLATFCGLVVGFPNILRALVIAIFAGGIAAGVFVLYRVLIRRSYSRFSAIAYGPYIIFGAVVMLLWPTWPEVLRGLFGG